jgi:hypothetical protein
VTPTNLNITTDHEHNKTLQQAYTQFAGVPRVCFNFFSAEDHQFYEDSIVTVLEKLSKSENVFLNLWGLTPMDYPISNKLVKVNPDPKDSSFIKHHTTFISNYIAERVLQRMKDVADAKLAETIFEGFRNPKHCSHAAQLFKMAAHRTFQHGFEIEAFLLTTDTTTTNNPLIMKIEGDPHRFFWLDVRACKGSRSVNPIYLNRYLIPWSKISNSVDAMWISEDTTVFIQMTKQLRHGMNFEGIFVLFEELPYNAKKNVCLLFVIPDDRSMESFHCQTINFPIGINDKDRKLVESFPQYVYCLSRQSIDCV